MKFISAVSFLSTLLFCCTGFCSEQEIIKLEYSGNRNTLFCGGKVTTFADCMKKYLQKHNNATAQDLLSLSYHGAFGPGSIFQGKAEEQQKLAADFAAVEAKDKPLFEIISPDYCLIDLAAWKFRKLPEAWLLNMYCASAEIFPDSPKIYDNYVSDICRIMPQFSQYLKQNAEKNPSLNIAKKSQYRVVSNRLLQMIPVLLKLAEFQGIAPRVIAIDGRAGSGKTTLSRQLAAVISAGTVHMDDFFLPLELRTKDRLNEPGGNVHYERFKAEVLPHLKNSSAFAYRRFDCSKMAPGEMRSVASSRWKIVEGAYSFHPALGNYADLKIFYDISRSEQLKRIRKRNGEKAVAAFTSRWIPLEEKYIKTFNIKEKADIVIGN